MSDDTTAAPGASSTTADSSFTALLRSDAVMLMIARKAMDEHGGGPDGDLAARRALDAELRASSGWPATRDYLTAAADYDRAGLGEDAELLRRIASTDHAVSAARTQWNLRYSDRPRTPTDDLIASLRDAGRLIDFDPSGPYLGIDGATYEPGVLLVSADEGPIVVVTGRGGSELLTSWPDHEAMAAWIATRGTTASGPLIRPSARCDCRAWEEDQVLARLLNSPSDAPPIVGTLPPSTFTTDVRYDIYQAIAHLGNHGAYTPDDVVAEVARRMTAVPGHGLHGYGGPAAPFARAYLNRLNETIIDRYTAMSVASVLAKEDTHYRSLKARQPGRAHHSSATVIRNAPTGAAQQATQADYRRPAQPIPGPAALPQP